MKPKRKYFSIKKIPNNFTCMNGGGLKTDFPCIDHIIIIGIWLNMVPHKT